jgi:hypothetical protein
VPYPQYVAIKQLGYPANTNDGNNAFALGFNPPVKD